LQRVDSGPVFRDDELIRRVDLGVVRRDADEVERVVEPDAPVVLAKLAGVSSVRAASAPLKVAVDPLAVDPPSTSVALASICTPPFPLTAFCTVSVPPEASIRPELVSVVALTTPNPSSLPPAAIVSDDPAPVTVKVPPPSCTRPSSVIGAAAVARLRPARRCNWPDAPIVRSVLSKGT
jgi:hypothetical protein